MLRAGIEGLGGCCTSLIGTHIAHKAVNYQGIMRSVGISVGMSLFGMGSITVYKVLKTFSPLSRSDLLVIAAVGAALPLLTNIYLNGRVASNNGLANGKYKVILVGATILLGFYILHKIYAPGAPDVLDHAPAILESQTELKPLESETKEMCEEVLKNGYGGIPGLDLKKHVSRINCNSDKLCLVMLTKEADKLANIDRIYRWDHFFSNQSLSISIMGYNKSYKNLYWCSPVQATAEQIKEGCEDILKQGFGFLPGMDLKKLVSKITARYDNPPTCNVQLSTEGKDLFNRNGNFWNHFFTFVVSNSCIADGKIDGSKQ